MYLFIYAPVRREGGIKRCFSTSVRRVHSKQLRIRRPSVPKFGIKVPHLWCDSHTSFRVKRSKAKVTRPIIADTHRAPYLPNGKVGCYIWYSQEGPRRDASPPSPLRALPNVTAHPSTASVPASYFSMWHYNNVCIVKS